MGMLMETVVAMDLKDKALWLAVAAVATNDLFCRYLMLWECQHRRLKVLLGNSMRAGCLIGAAVFLLGLVRFSLVKTAMESQPRWIYFHENMFLILGHLINLTGIGLLLACANTRGMFQFLISVHFNVFEERIPYQTFPYSTFEDPVSVATCLSFFGFALLNASQSGIILTLLTWFCSSYGLARFISPGMTS